MDGTLPAISPLVTSSRSESLSAYREARRKQEDYHHDLETLIWRNEGRKYAFRPHEIDVASVEGREEARRLMDDMVVVVNAIWKRRADIKPSLGRRRLAGLTDIYKLLPATNCKECAYLYGRRRNTKFEGTTKQSHRLIRKLYEQYEEHYGSVLCKDVREKAEQDCPEVVGLAAKWTAQVLLDEFSTHSADNADAPSALEDNEDREMP